MDNGHEVIKFTTKCVTIDSYKFDDVDFIKIDTEGNELDVLRGSINTIKKCKPIIYYEDKGNTDEYIGEVKSFFKKLGYKIKRQHRFWMKDKQPKCDMLAIPN